MRRHDLCPNLYIRITNLLLTMPCGLLQSQSFEQPGWRIRGIALLNCIGLSVNLILRLGSILFSNQYSNCECLGQGITATTGYCPLECNNVIMYVCIFSFFVLIHSTSEVGSMLLTLRCVHAKDKAMAMGLIQFAIGLFGK